MGPLRILQRDWMIKSPLAQLSPAVVWGRVGELGLEGKRELRAHQTNAGRIDEGLGVRMERERRQMR